MKYFIKKNNRETIDVEEDDYKQLKEIHEKLIDVLLIEEALEIVLANYFELEKTLLDISLKASIFNTIFDQENSFNELNTIDRKIFNLVASCTMYIHHTAKSFSKIYGNTSNEYIKLEGITEGKGKNKKRIQNGIKNNEYDSNFAYRVMEQIRNHIQHYGLLDNVISKGQEKKDYPYLENRIDVKTKIEPFDSDKTFKKCVLEKLKKIEGVSFDIVKYIKEYLVSIGIIHLEIRKILEKDVNKWDESILNFMGKHKKTKNDIFYLVAYNINSSEIIAKIDLVPDRLITHRKNLQEKNDESHLKSYSIKYVSNKI